MTNFVHKTVNGLKSLLDEKGAIQLFCSKGDIMEFLVTFSQDKATLNDIQSLEAKHQITLPEDYQKFMTLHNGAKIFEILSDGENIGGGLQLFSLEEIKEESQEEIKKLKESGEIDEVLPKWNEPEYQPENQTSGSLGTKGDVLVSYEINSGSWSIGVGHAAIVSRNKAKTVEAWHKKWSPIKQDGVRRYTNNWGSKKKVYGLWVKKSNNTKYINAAKYAEKQADAKKKYNLNFFDKNTTKKFYCSQLAWRSWKNQGHDIDNVKWDTLVTPMELVKSNNTKIFHHRK
ncbi:hypothetical protein BKN48_20310 [Bacillus subtilis]|nr:SMI1/KNR4 family protein [Bacillus subtilis]AOY07524.1 hypothetical protein BKN48_20310 [Bacillus subtilis]